MATFLRQWGRLVAADLSKLKDWSGVLKLLGSATVLGLLTTAAAWLGTVPAWVLPVVAAVVCYLSLTAGRAWESASYPAVEVGPLQLDTAMKVFFIHIANGLMPTKRVEIKILPVYDSHRLKHTEKSFQGHWRGEPPIFDGKLSAGEEAEYGLLGANYFRDSKNPTLFIYSREHMQAGAFPTISQDVPLEEQGASRVVVVVNCEAEDGTKGKTQRKIFYVAPDPGSTVGYKVEAAPITEGQSFLLRLRRAVHGAYCRWVLQKKPRRLQKP
jgi:hypothetical protein